MRHTIYIHETFRFGKPGVVILEIDVPENSTVLDVKHILSNTWSVPIEKILLIVSGRQITNEEICDTHISTIVRK